jgi:hypothetical protein
VVPVTEKVRVEQDTVRGYAEAVAKIPRLAPKVVFAPSVTVYAALDEVFVRVAAQLMVPKVMVFDAAKLNATIPLAPVIEPEFV